MSSLPLRKILIAGASGSLGTALLSTLSAHPQFSLTILTRASSSSRFPPHIPVVTISDAFTTVELTAAFRGQDAVVNALTTQTSAEESPRDELGLRVVDACVAAGPAPEAQAAVPVFRAKGEVIEYLRRKTTTQEQPENGLTWTALGVGSWLDWTLVKGFIKIHVKERKATVFDSGTHKFTATPPPSVALATARVLLLDPAMTANRYFYFQSFACSQRDIIAELERQTGEAWAVEAAASGAEIAKARERLTGGDATAVFDLLAASFLGDVEVPTGAWFEESGRELANDLIGGLPKVTLEDVVRDVLKKTR